MNLYAINKKLRIHNRSHYSMLIFSCILSILLVTSYAVMFLSPTVQSVLPSGGDSNKQAYLVFALAIVGCMLFTTYASSLFFKYKSREVGILLSLGAKRSKIRYMLFVEIITIIIICLFFGILLSIPVSYLIWKLFQLFIIDSQAMTYQIGWSGIKLGLVFSFIVSLSIIIKAYKFVKQTNIIDALNTTRKCEMVKEIKPWYGTVGLFLIVSGLFLGYFLPSIMIYYYHKTPTAIWNAFYLFSIIGLYMFITYCIIHSSRGKNPHRYYRNIIPKSMMKFMGKQTVKSICVSSLLISATLFTAFYTPTAMTSVFYTLDNTPYNYSFHHKVSEDQISKNDIMTLATKYDITIDDYREVTLLSLIASGKQIKVQSSDISYEHIEKYKTREFINLNDFNKISGMNVKLKEGEYITIVSEESSESMYERFDDLDRITHPITYASTPLSYEGTINFSPLVKEGCTNFIISDEDYKKFTYDLPKTSAEKLILFNVDPDNDSYDFADELKNNIIQHSSDDVAVINYYNEYEKIRTLREGKKYPTSYESLDISIDNNHELFMAWKYYPKFSILLRQNVFKNMAVFFMLFIYISIICLIAVSIISYTRSLTIANNNKYLFNDLRKLGANNRYIERCIKSLLRKMYILPTLTGSFMVYVFFALIMYGNSSNITSSEWIALKTNLIIIVLYACYMYLLYRISLSKFKKIINN